MSHEKGLQLIETCLKTGGDYMEGYQSQDRSPNVVIRDGAKCTVYPINTGGYPLNLDSVRILAWHEFRSTESMWDGNFASYAIFSFNKGLGVAYQTGWWSPTFSEDQYDMDIQEDHDWHKFINMVLTDELRDKLSHVRDTLDEDVAEIILLNRDCD